MVVIDHLLIELTVAFLTSSSSFLAEPSGVRARMKRGQSEIVSVSEQLLSFIKQEGRKTGNVSSNDTLNTLNLP